MDIRDEGFDWVGRHCIKDKDHMCKNETIDQDTPGFDWVKKIPLVEDQPDFEVQVRVCE